MSDEALKVLLVDDEEDFVDMLSLRLEASGVEASTVTSGEACLGFLEEAPVDAVVLDVKMPGMDGLETLRRVKSKWPDLPVIMMTGHGSVESAEEGAALGAFDYLIKPADFDELMAKLRAATGRA